MTEDPGSLATETEPASPLGEEDAGGSGLRTRALAAAVVAVLLVLAAGGGSSGGS